MKKQILLGIDVHFTPATQHAVHAVAGLFASDESEIHFLLCHIISITHIVTEQPGYYIEQIVPLSPTEEQRSQATIALNKAQDMLQQHGFAADQIEQIIRVGAPADEIAKIARERHAMLIVTGSRGNAWPQRLRRFCLGSISRRILHLAPCPVLIAVPPPPRRSEDLASWYETAIKQHLSEHSQSLTVLTAERVAQQFLPIHKKVADKQEIEAAQKALERLANSGMLYRRGVDGSMSYVND